MSSNKKKVRFSEDSYQKNFQENMNIYYFNPFPTTHAIKKQIELRNKQIHILYTQGRPIFGRFKEHS